MPQLQLMEGTQVHELHSSDSKNSNYTDLFCYSLLLGLETAIASNIAANEIMNKNYSRAQILAACFG